MASPSDQKATIIDGKAIVQSVRSEIADEARQLSEKYGKGVPDWQQIAKELPPIEAFVK